MDRVSVSDAAKLLGVSPQYIREGLKRNRLPIGSCVKMSSVWTYHISQKLLDDYIRNAVCAATQTAKPQRIENSAERTEVF